MLLFVPMLNFAQLVDSSKIRIQIDSLIELNQSLSDARKFDQAIASIELAKSKAIETFGTSNSLYVNCIYNHAATLYSMRRLSKSETIYLEAKQLVEKSTNVDSALYSNILNNLGLIYLDMGRFNEAENLLLKSKNIRESVLGNRSRKYIGSLQNLAFLYSEMNRYDLAASYFSESLKLHAAAYGKLNLDYAANLNNQASMNMDMGRYLEAEKIYLEVLSIFKMIKKEDSNDFCMTSNNLGNLYKKMGRYESSEKYYLLAKKIREQNKETETTSYANSLINLGTLKAEIGQLENAEPFLLQAESIISKAIGKANPQYAGCIRNLGILYKDLNNYPLAMQYFLESKKIIEDKLGTENLNYANAITNLADIYMRLNRFDSAQILYSNSLAIIEKKNKSKGSLDYIRGLTNLALLKEKMGLTIEAKQLYLEGMNLFESTFGENSLDFVSILNRLGNLYWKIGRFADASDLMLRSDTIQRSLLVLATRHLSEAELLQYNGRFLKHMEQCLSLLYQHPQEAERLQSVCYHDAVFHKGFFLTASKRVKNLALNDSLLAGKYESFNLLNRQLFKEYSKGRKEQDAAQIANLKESISLLEKELVILIAGSKTDFQQIAVDQIKLKLHPNEVSIEFVKFNVYRPDQTDRVMYAALVLTPEKEQPVFIPLFEESQLQQLLAASNRSESIGNLYASRGANPIRTATSTGLYELIWKPLLAELANKKTIYYSPTGLLHHINFDAITVDQKQILSDQFDLIRLGTTRAIAEWEPQKTLKTGNAYLFGGIDYVSSNSLPIDELKQTEFANSHHDELSFSYAERSHQGNQDWTFLPGTLKEVESISKILSKAKIPATTYIGANASEVAFKSMGRSKQAPKILHIATHGYFFSDQVSSPGDKRALDSVKKLEHVSRMDETKKAASSNSKGEFESNEPVFKISDHPMLRSGLILAGANASWIDGAPLKNETEDGILTAFEISQMNLANTELVVLSACETGLGEIKGHEGVYGLQRAFKIAGVKYLMMSLWQIPDVETKEFMVSFYKHWLTDKHSIPEAFNLAQQEMRIKFGDPYKWAGFILLE